MSVSVKIKVPRSLTPLARAAGEPVVQQALRAIGVYGVHQLSKAAQEKLGPFAGQAYIRGLQAPDSVIIEKLTLTITLNGEFPNALEQGAPPWDIKKKMLAKAVKKAKDGSPIVDVPFEHGVPGTTGKPAMPKAEHGLMQKAIREAKATGAPIARGPKTMPTRPVEKRVKLPGSERPAVYTPKRGPYDSMIHIAKQTGKGTTGRYLTIRRISVNSDPASWIHPGFKALNLFPAAKTDIETTGTKVLADYLENA